MIVLVIDYFIRFTTFILVVLLCNTSRYPASTWEGKGRRKGRDGTGRRRREGRKGKEGWERGKKGGRGTRGEVGSGKLPVVTLRVEAFGYLTRGVACTHMPKTLP